MVAWRTTKISPGVLKYQTGLNLFYRPQVIDEFTNANTYEWNYTNTWCLQ